MTDVVRWRKSSFSSGGGECMEVAIIDDESVAARDSKAPGAGVVLVPAGSWSAFLRWLY